MEYTVKSAWEEWEITDFEPLGRGGYGRVYKAVKKDSYGGTPMYAAIKIISVPSQEDEEDIAGQKLAAENSATYLEQIKNEYVHEIELMINLRGMPNIIHIEDYKVVGKEEKPGWDIHIRMELLESFSSYSDRTAEGKLSEQEIIKVGTDICSALERCAKQPVPVIHRDIKPANILVAKSGDYVLSDFGIARKAEKTTYTKGRGTERYIAPEIYSGGHYDAKADIYSLGLVLYELSNNGKPPFCPPDEQIIIPSKRTEAAKKRLSGEKLPPPVNASGQMAQVVLTACEFDPAKRFQSAGEFKSALESIKKSGYKPERNIKKIYAAATALMAVIALCAAIYIGANLFAPTVLSLEIEPQYVTLSIQQTTNLTISKIMSNGDVITINPNNLAWESENGNIAKIDGNRILGVNFGTTTIHGYYQDNIISLIVNVVEPMEGLTDIVLQYQLGGKVKLFGGTNEREHIDGALDGVASFVLPASIAAADDGTIYIADSMVLRRIYDGTVEIAEIAPFYMTPDIVRCNKNDVYIATRAWEKADGGTSYAVIKLGQDNKAEVLYTADAFYTSIADFGFGGDLLYFIERNEVFGEIYLKTLNLQDYEDIRQICKLAKGTNTLAIGENSEIYLANQETGVIQVYDGELKYFAGIENARAFIDGSAPLFFMPQKIKYADGTLYVWDFNTLRKIEIVDEKNIYCTTLAGQASPDFDMEIEPENDAESVILANSSMCDFAVVDGTVILTDPKRGVIWRIG